MWNPHNEGGLSARSDLIMISCNTCEFQGGFTIPSSNLDQTSGFCEKVPILKSYLCCFISNGKYLFYPPITHLCQKFAPQKLPLTPDLCPYSRLDLSVAADVVS